MKKENYFPAGIAGKVLLFGGIESLARVCSLLLGPMADAGLLLLASAVILCASTVFPSRQSAARTGTFALGLVMATLGGVYLFDNRLLGVVGVFLGYTIGSIILFTAHMVADKDLDNWIEETRSPLGKAGGSVMVLLSILAVVGTTMRASAILH